jgi:hypothetical protein
LAGGRVVVISKNKKRRSLARGGVLLCGVLNDARGLPTPIFADGHALRRSESCMNLGPLPAATMRCPVLREKRLSLHQSSNDITRSSSI